MSFAFSKSERATLPGPVRKLHLAFKIGLGCFAFTFLTAMGLCVTGNLSARTANSVILAAFFLLFSATILGGILWRRHYARMPPDEEAQMLTWELEKLNRQKRSLSVIWMPALGLFVVGFWFSHRTRSDIIGFSFLAIVCIVSNALLFCFDTYRIKRLEVKLASVQQGAPQA